MRNTLAEQHACRMTRTSSRPCITRRTPTSRCRRHHSTHRGHHVEARRRLLRRDQGARRPASRFYREVLAAATTRLGGDGAAVAPELLHSEDLKRRRRRSAARARGSRRWRRANHTRRGGRGPRPEGARGPQDRAAKVMFYWVMDDAPRVTKIAGFPQPRCGRRVDQGQSALFFATSEWRTQLRPTATTEARLLRGDPRDCWHHIRTGSAFCSRRW